MPRRYWDDFSPGQVIDCGSRIITREEIIAFADEYDPQPMHLDEEAARATMLGGLIASGWHSCCILMAMLTEHFLSDTSVLGLPGIEEGRWLAPIRPGERVAARATVLETGCSAERPDWGFVKFRFELVDASGKALMSLTASPAFARHAAADAAGTRVQASSPP